MKNKSKNYISYGIAIAFLVVIVSFIAFAAKNNNSSKGNSSNYSASALSALESSFDFNTISMKDGKVSHKFEVKNEGAEPVKIEKAYTSCMCTAALITDSSGKKQGPFGMPGHGGISKANIEVGPGESVIVEAVFDPEAHGPSGVGLAQRSIYLETNSTESPNVELSFTATVTR